MIRAIIVSFVCLAITAESKAQNACDAILRWGVRDTENQFNANYDFKQTQYYLCHSSFQSASSAKSASATLGIDIEDVLGLDIGGAKAETNYQTWRSNLCTTEINTIQNNNQFISSIKKASATITGAWSKCTEQGFVGWLSPMKDPQVFKMTLQYKSGGSNHVKIDDFSIEPDSVSCKPKVGAGHFDGSKEWLCKRDAKGTKAVSFVVNSDRGPASGELPAFVADAPGPLPAPCTSTSAAGKCLACQFDLKNFSHIAVDSYVSFSCPSMPVGGIVDIYATGRSTADCDCSEGTWVRFQLSGQGIDQIYDAAGPNVNSFTLSAQSTVPNNGLMGLKLYNRLSQFGDGRMPGHTNRPATILDGSMTIRVIQAIVP